jgi:lipopolysaccharide transport protein LptA
MKMDCKLNTFMKILHALYGLSMRNSARKHKPVLVPGWLAVLPLSLFLPFSLSGQQQFSITSEDMVALHADQAWEAIEPDTLHFAGHFEMRVGDMVLSADRATLYGTLNDPDRLVLEGSPARLSVSQTKSGGVETIQAEAQEMLYERESNLMLLNGAARLAQGDNVLVSNRIEYDISTDRFRTQGQTGVQIDVHPQE